METDEFIFNDHDCVLWSPETNEVVESNPNDALKTEEFYNGKFVVPIDKGIIDYIIKFNRYGYKTDQSCEGECANDGFVAPYIKFKPLDLAKANNIIGICLRLDSMNVSAEKADNALYNLTIQMSNRYLNFCFENNDEPVSDIFEEYKEMLLNDLKIILRLIGD